MESYISCPFCSKKKAILKSRKDLNCKFFWVECTNCKSKTPTYTSKDEALKIWNVNFLEKFMNEKTKPVKIR